MSRLSRSLVYNRIYGTQPFIAHAPGKVDESPWWKVLRAAVFASEDRFTSPPSVDVITWNSGRPDSIPSLRGHSLGLFERSLDHFGVRHTVLGAGLGKDWSNRMKLDLTLDFLSQSGADFVLGADSADALLIGDVGVLLEHCQEPPASLHGRGAAISQGGVVPVDVNSDAARAVSEDALQQICQLGIRHAVADHAVYDVRVVDAHDEHWRCVRRAGRGELHELVVELQLQVL